MKLLVQRLRSFINENPAFLLLIFVYLYILPNCLSYDNAWMQPEEFNIKRAVLINGPHLSFFDLKNGLDWVHFENFQPRCSRPLSSYFEILDTKFRSWAWHFVLPHPSFSLTWIFSFILAPIFLYKLLRNSSISSNVAISLVAFYLATPEVLSCGAMLFRPAKPMTNFFIILCLYLASELKKRFIEQDLEIPLRKFMVLMGLIGFSIFWDETALLILPAILVLFPHIFKARMRLLFFLVIPLVVVMGYLVIIPQLTLWAGYDFPRLMTYHKIVEIKHVEMINFAIQLFAINAKNLILETMGIIVPVSNQASMIVKIMVIAATISWGAIFYYISKVKIKADNALLFLVGLVVFFDYLMTITNGVWGPYYYGDFWSVFFVYCLASYIEKAQIPKFILTALFFLILISLFNCFIATNTIYKRYHFYPCMPKQISLYYDGEKTRFDLNDKPFITGEELKAVTYVYWSQLKEGKSIDYSYLPKELYWMPIELEPSRLHPRYLLPEN